MPVTTPGMTTGNTANGHPAPTKQTIFLKSFDGICRAGGCEPAFRAEPGRNDHLINPDQENKRVTKYLQDLFHIKPSPVYPEAFLKAQKFLRNQPFPCRYKLRTDEDSNRFSEPLFPILFSVTGTIPGSGV